MADDWNEYINLKSWQLWCIATWWRYSDLNIENVVAVAILIWPEVDFHTFAAFMDR